MTKKTLRRIAWGAVAVLPLLVCPVEKLWIQSTWKGIPLYGHTRTIRPVWFLAYANYVEQSIGIPWLLWWVYVLTLIVVAFRRIYQRAPG